MTAGSPGGVFGPFKTIEHPHVSQLEAPLPYLQHFHRHFSAGFFGGHGPLRTLHGDSEAAIESLAMPPLEARTGTGIKSQRRSIYPPSASPGRMNNGNVLEGKLLQNTEPGNYDNPVRKWQYPRGSPESAQGSAKETHITSAFGPAVTFF